MDVYQRLKELGLELPQPPGRAGIYAQVREFGENLFYVSGMGPNTAGEEEYFGKVGSTYTLEEGQQAARKATLNLLAVLQKNLGDLNKIKRIAKLLCFVASDDEFYCQPEVANAASQLLIDIFGEERGIASRSAIGVNVLPGNIPFEIEILAEIEQ